MINVYPTPYNKEIHNELCFPISDNIYINEKVFLTIYDVNQTMILSQILETTIDNAHRVVKFSPNNLPSGVYTFTISRDDIDVIGKFVIK